jgi:hypothetical protein
MAQSTRWIRSLSIGVGLLLMAGPARGQQIVQDRAASSRATLETVTVTNRNAIDVNYVTQAIAALSDLVQVLPLPFAQATPLASAQSFQGARPAAPQGSPQAYPRASGQAGPSQPYGPSQPVPSKQGLPPVPPKQGPGSPPVPSKQGPPPVPSKQGPGSPPVPSKQGPPPAPSKQAPPPRQTAPAPAPGAPRFTQTIRQRLREELSSIVQDFTEAQTRLLIDPTDFLAREDAANLNVQALGMVSLIQRLPEFQAGAEAP